MKVCTRTPLTHKALAFLLSFTLTTSFHLSEGAPLYAAEPLASVVMPQDLHALQLPEKFGTIRETFQSKSDKTVILVQDAHAVPDAQKSIQNVIDYFQKEHGLSLVAVEGVSSEIDTQFLRSFPNQKLLEQMMQRYAQRGELTGAVAASLFNERNALYRGIEDWALYEKGLSYFLAAMYGEETVLKSILQQQDVLNERKEGIYSEKLLAIDQALEGFRQNFKGIVPVLQKLAQVQVPAQGSELALMLQEAKETQNKDALQTVDSEIRKVAKQVEAFFSQVRGRKGAPFSKEQLKKDTFDFQTQFQAYQTSRLAPKEFALRLKEFAKKYRIRVRVTKQLDLLTRRQERMEDIQGTRLFRDFEAYVQQIKEQLFENDEQRELDQQYRRVVLLEQISKLELPYSSWDEMKTWLTTPDTLTQEVMADNLWQELRPNIAFYENAEERDRIFAENLNKMMKEEKTNASLLVTGGFHTQGLTERLKRQNISYILVTPHVGVLPNEINYKDHMRGDVTWGDYFQVEDGAINVHEAFTRYTRDQLLQATRTNSQAQDGRTLKLWRDQILRDLAAQGKSAKAARYTRYIDELNQKGKTINRQALWEKQVYDYAENLRKLHNNNRLNEQNIRKLFLPATMLAVAVAMGANDPSQTLAQARQMQADAYRVLVLTALLAQAQQRGRRRSETRLTAANPVNITVYDGRSYAARELQFSDGKIVTEFSFPMATGGTIYYLLEGRPRDTALSLHPAISGETDRFTFETVDGDFNTVGALDVIFDRATQTFRSLGTKNQGALLTSQNVYGSLITADRVRRSEQRDDVPEQVQQGEQLVALLQGTLGMMIKQWGRQRIDFTSVSGSPLEVGNPSEAFAGLDTTLELEERESPEAVARQLQAFAQRVNGVLAQYGVIRARGNISGLNREDVATLVGLLGRVSEFVRNPDGDSAEEIQQAIVALAMPLAQPLINEALVNESSSKANWMLSQIGRWSGAATRFTNAVALTSVASLTASAQIFSPTHTSRSFEFIKRVPKLRTLRNRDDIKGVLSGSQQALNELLSDMRAELGTGFISAAQSAEFIRQWKADRDKKQQGLPFAATMVIEAILTYEATVTKFFDQEAPRDEQGLRPLRGGASASELQNAGIVLSMVAMIFEQFQKLRAENGLSLGFNNQAGNLLPKAHAYAKRLQVAAQLTRSREIFIYQPPEKRATDYTSVPFTSGKSVRSEQRDLAVLPANGDPIPGLDQRFNNIWSRPQVSPNGRFAVIPTLFQTGSGNMASLVAIALDEQGRFSGDAKLVAATLEPMTGLADRTWGLDTLNPTPGSEPVYFNPDGELVVVHRYSDQAAGKRYIETVAVRINSDSLAVENVDVLQRSEDRFEPISDASIEQVFDTLRSITDGTLIQPGNIVHTPDASHVNVSAALFKAEIESDEVVQIRERMTEQGPMDFSLHGKGNQFRFRVNSSVQGVKGVDSVRPAEDIFGVLHKEFGGATLDYTVSINTPKIFLSDDGAADSLRTVLAHQEIILEKFRQSISRDRMSYFSLRIGDVVVSADVWSRGRPVPTYFLNGLSIHHISDERVPSKQNIDFETDILADADGLAKSAKNVLGKKSEDRMVVHEMFRAGGYEFIVVRTGKETEETVAITVLQGGQVQPELGYVAEVNWLETENLKIDVGGPVAENEIQLAGDNVLPRHITIGVLRDKVVIQSRDNHPQNERFERAGKNLKIGILDENGESKGAVPDNKTYRLGEIDLEVEDVAEVASDDAFDLDAFVANMDVTEPERVTGEFVVPSPGEKGPVVDSASDSSLDVTETANRALMLQVTQNVRFIRAARRFAEKRGTTSSLEAGLTAALGNDVLNDYPDAVPVKDNNVSARAAGNEFGRSRAEARDDEQPEDRLLITGGSGGSRIVTPAGAGEIVLPGDVVDQGGSTADTLAGIVRELQPAADLLVGGSGAQLLSTGLPSDEAKPSRGLVTTDGGVLLSATAGQIITNVDDGDSTAARLARGKPTPGAELFTGGSGASQLLGGLEIPASGVINTSAGGIITNIDDGDSTAARLARGEPVPDILLRSGQVSDEAKRSRSETRDDEQPEDRLLITGGSGGSGIVTPAGAGEIVLPGDLTDQGGSTADTLAGIVRELQPAADLLVGGSGAQLLSTGLPSDEAKPSRGLVTTDGGVLLSATAGQIITNVDDGDSTAARLARGKPTPGAELFTGGSGASQLLGGLEIPASGVIDTSAGGIITNIDDGDSTAARLARGLQRSETRVISLDTEMVIPGSDEAVANVVATAFAHPGDGNRLREAMAGLFANAPAGQVGGRLEAVTLNLQLQAIKQLAARRRAGQQLTPEENAVVDAHISQGAALADSIFAANDPTQAGILNTSVPGAFGEAGGQPILDIFPSLTADVALDTLRAEGDVKLEGIGPLASRWASRDSREVFGAHVSESNVAGILNSQDVLYMARSAEALTDATLVSTEGAQDSLHPEVARILYRIVLRNAKLANAYGRNYLIERSALLNQLPDYMMVTNGVFNWNGAGFVLQPQVLEDRLIELAFARSA